MDADASDVIQLQMDVEKIVQDVDWNELVDEIKRRLDRIKQNIKQSETARNFYNDILQLTGDNALSSDLTISIYGTIGEDFGQRVQDEMMRTLEGVKNLIPEDFFNEIMGDVTIMDVDEIKKKLSLLPKVIQPIFLGLLGDIQQNNAKIARDYAKLLMKYDEIKQQEVNITKKAEEDRLAIEKGLTQEIDGIRKNTAIEDKKAAEDAARDRAAWAKHSVDLYEEAEKSKLKDNYKYFFNSVWILAEETARKVAIEQKTFLAQQLSANQIGLDEYLRTIEKISSSKSMKRGRILSSPILPMGLTVSWRLFKNKYTI